MPDPNREIWEDPTSLATPLVALFLDRAGMEAVHWHPEAIKAEILDHFHAVPVDAAFNRLMAGLAVINSNRFFTSVPDFIVLANTLTDGTFDPTVFDPADVYECAWATTEALLLSPPDRDDDQIFSPDVAAYVAAACRAEGLLAPPPVLAWAGGRPLSEAVETVRADFSDDPDLYAGIAETQNSRLEDVTAFLQNRLQLLADQLGRLKLINGDASGAARRLPAALSAT